MEWTYISENLTPLKCNFLKTRIRVKVEKILKGSQDSIPSPSASVKIQITGGKV